MYTLLEKQLMIAIVTIVGILIIVVGLDIIIRDILKQKIKHLEELTEAQNSILTETQKEQVKFIIDSQTEKNNQ